LPYLATKYKLNPYYSILKSFTEVLKVFKVLKVLRVLRVLKVRDEE